MSVSTLDSRNPFIMALDTPASVDGGTVIVTAQNLPGASATASSIAAVPRQLSASNFRLQLLTPNSYTASGYRGSVGVKEPLYAAAAGSGHVRISVDGETWSIGSLPGVGVQVFGMCWSDTLGLWIISCDSGTVILDEDFGAVAVDGGYVGGRAMSLGTRVVSVGSAGTIRTSDDGLNWTTRTAPGYVFYFQGLAVDPVNQIWIASGGGGGCFRSVDGGETWVASPSGVGDSLQYAAFGNGVFILTTNVTPGYLLRSTDGGLTWSAALTDIGNLSRVYGIGWSDVLQQFVLLGEEVVQTGMTYFGVAAVSPTGEPGTWTKIRTRAPDTLRDVTDVGDGVMLVGEAGGILMSLRV